MQIHRETFGPYELAIYGGGVAMARNGKSVWLQGDDAATLTAEYEDLCSDLALNPDSRAYRIGERGIAQELFDAYFE